MAGNLIVRPVTSADRPFTETERAFMERIRAWGKKVVVVLNKVDLKQLRAYDYSYGYTYPYGNVQAPANGSQGVKSRNA